MSKYWSHYSQSAKWSHQSGTQPCTVAFFVERSNIWPNPSLGPALGPRRRTPLCRAHQQRVLLCAGLMFLMAPARRSRTFSVGSCRSFEVFVLVCHLEGGGGGGTDSAELLKWYRGIWVHMFPAPTFIHVIRPAVPASMEALCWLPLLTSERWPAPRRWALTTEQGLEQE